MEPSFLKSICPLLFERSDNAWVMQARTQEDPVLAGDRVRVRILTPCHVYVFCPNRGAFVKAFFVQRSSDDRAWQDTFRHGGARAGAACHWHLLSSRMCGPEE